jgi:hypothetical protein
MQIQQNDLRTIQLDRAERLLSRFCLAGRCDLRELSTRMSQFQVRSTVFYFENV